MARIVPILLAAGLLASPVAAQPPELIPRAEGLAQAEAIIAEADAKDLFTPDAWERGAVTRHTQSGLTCRFFHDSQDRILVYQHGARGDDVSCLVGADLMTISIYATRTNLTGGYRQSAAGAEAALKGRFANLEVYDGPLADDLYAGLPAHVTRRFLGDVEGERYYTRLTVFDGKGWTYKLRLSAPADFAVAADRVAATVVVSLARDGGYDAGAARAPSP